MKKKILSVVVIILLLATLSLGLFACNSNDTNGVIDLEDGSRPNYVSLLLAEDISLINAAMAKDADEATKKKAVMTLYNVANYSRKNTSLSLMIQNSNVGVPSYLGTVIMHAFTLRSGDSWYYQLATGIDSPMASVMGALGAGIVKVAYTLDGGDYYYSLIKDFDFSGTESDCSLETFPYATFKLTKEPTLYAEDSFKEEIHYLDSMLEINNMAFCEEIIADGAKISYDKEHGYYTVDFEVDMSADSELISKWYEMAQKDMQVSGNSITGYNSYKATLQVWNNGYAKYFKSYADRTATGSASGKPVDEFKYFWVEQEIMALLSQDTSVENVEEMTAPIDYIAFYTNTEIVKAKTNGFVIAAIVIGCVLGAVIITVIIIEILVRCGKLPKLAARRKARKDKRRKKRAAKKGESFESLDGDLDMNESDVEQVDEPGEELNVELVNESQSDKIID